MRIWEAVVEFISIMAVRGGGEGRYVEVGKVVTVVRGD
jgi:hypothetical protein